MHKFAKLIHGKFILNELTNVLIGQVPQNRVHTAAQDHVK